MQARACFIVDDVISTGGTIAESVKALLEAGARPEIVAATHALLLPGAAPRGLGGGTDRPRAGMVARLECEET